MVENFNEDKNPNIEEFNAKENFNSKIEEDEEFDISEIEKEPLSEICQNTTSLNHKKRKHDLFLNNSKLKFIKCNNITINITK